MYFKLNYVLWIWSHLLSWNRLHAQVTKSLPVDSYILVRHIDNNNGSLLLNNHNINFAEGGTINSSLGNELNYLMTEKSKLVEKNKILSQSLELDLSDGAPVIGPSSVGSKGIVARKGAPPPPPPCTVNNTSDLLCTPSLPISVKTESVNASVPPHPVYESAFDVSQGVSGSHSVPNNNRTNETAAAQPVKTPNSKAHHLKPTITVVPADSDEILRILKNDRNVVIPVVGLVCMPIIVLLLLFVYKRCQASRDGASYERMGFLIEDIYND